VALQLGATRDAFLAAGVPPDKANAAAEELAGYDNRLAGMDARLSGIEARLGILTWAVGINAALTLAVLAKLIVQH
jgi:hypothetical protein